jgi:hypothetical protein
MDDAGALDQRPTDPSETPLPQVPLAQIWRWLAPSTIAMALTVVFLFGLWSASRAMGPGAEAVGFAASGLALIGLAWELEACFDGAAPALLVDTSEALLLLVGLLSALGVAGLVLAAKAQGVAAPAAGYALFGAAVALIFWNIKHYFDREEEGSAADSSASRQRP